jgi:endonuclease-3 related protein
VRLSLSSDKEAVIKIYGRLLFQYGNRNWWPGETPFEVMIGAILTQSVSWKNVKTAIDNLKREGILDPDRLYKTEMAKLTPLIKSTRFYNQKAKKIQQFLKFYSIEYDFDLHSMSIEETSLLRTKLLSINGLGEETVDSILLYACNKPIFVVDAYTKRIFSRYGLINEDMSYGSIQEFFMRNVPEDIQIYNDYHAQIVLLGQSVCKRDPKCESCPIRNIDDSTSCHYSLDDRA